MRFFNEVASDEKQQIFYRKPSSFTKHAARDYLRFCIGAALYMPATRQQIAQDILTNKYPTCTTMVIDLEDAIGDDQVEVGIYQLVQTLTTLYDAIETNPSIEDQMPLLFVRVRNAVQLQEMTELLGHLQHVLTGYMLPKFTPKNGRDFLRIIEAQNKAGFSVYAMPILETKEILYKEQRMPNLLAVREILLEFEPYVLNVRIGSTDFCGLFGVRRSIRHSVYDLAVVKDCLADILNLFQQQEHYFVVSGSVWEYFSNEATIDNAAMQGLLKELELDCLNGFVGKTIIHPSHIDAVNAMYIVSHEEFIDAQGILLHATGEIGVQKSEYANKMNEMKPHYLWAKRIMLRADIYGVFQRDMNVQKFLQERVSL